MCLAKQKRWISATKLAAKSLSNPTPDWIAETITGGSLPHVDPHTGVNGWASAAGKDFVLRPENYFTKREKSPADESLLTPLGVDLLRSSTKVDNVLARSDNRVAGALRKAQSRGESLNSFIFAVNFQVPGKDKHSAVFYFATEHAIPVASLFDQFINGDDAFRNQRFKIVYRIVKARGLMKIAVGNHSARLLGKVFRCTYHRGENYLEIDVDIASSMIARVFWRLAFGYVTRVTIDMGFLVEAQAEDELPERLLGAVRVCQITDKNVTHICD